MIAVVRLLPASAVLTATLLLVACGREAPLPAPAPSLAGEVPPVKSVPVPVPMAPASQPVAYKVEGGADAWHGVGIVCDFTRPFELGGGGLTMRFTPTSKDGGTYAYDGILEGFAVRGGEAYSVEWIGTSPVKIKGWGVGTVDTPLGPQSDNGTEHYTIERSTAACPTG